jgi:hypothetical protein
METSSPLSLFEAVFRVLEERLPFGRQIVTILSALMAAVLFVFCIGYLFSALAVATNWALLSFRTKSFVAVPQFSTKYDSFGWFLFVGLILVIYGVTAYGLFQLRRAIEENNVIIGKIKQNDALIKQLISRPRPTKES